MKKIVLISTLLLCSFQILLAQTYSTGKIDLSVSNDYSAEIDVEGSTVTLTLVGPDGRWMGIGFGETCMVNEGDVVLFNGTTLSDRQFIEVGIPPGIDANQDWTIVSNTESGGVRTMKATRVLNTGNEKDYVFSTTEEPITIVWALGSSNNISSHGRNRGATSSNFVLDIEDLFTEQFSMAPVPTHDLVSLTLPKEVTSGDIIITDYTGKTVSKTIIDNVNKTLDISSLQNGIYLIRFDTNKGIITRKISKI